MVSHNGSDDANTTLAKWIFFAIAPRDLSSKTRFIRRKAPESGRFRRYLMLEYGYKQLLLICFLYFKFLISIEYRILLYFYCNMRQYHPKSGRRAVIQAAKDGHTPRPERLRGMHCPFFPPPRHPILQQPLSCLGSPFLVKATLVPATEPRLEQSNKKIERHTNPLNIVFPRIFFEFHTTCGSGLGVGVADGS